MSLRMARVLRKVTEEIRRGGILIGPAESGIYRSSWQPHGPLCLTCGRVVQKEELTEMHRNLLEVRFQCHGQDEKRIYDLGTEYLTDEERYEKLRSLRMSDRLFDPLQGHSDPGFAAMNGAQAGSLAGGLDALATANGLSPAAHANDNSQPEPTVIVADDSITVSARAMAEGGYLVPANDTTPSILDADGKPANDTKEGAA